MYTILLRSKNRGKFRLANFESEHVKVNTAVLQEIFRMREAALFYFTIFC